MKPHIRLISGRPARDLRKLLKRARVLYGNSRYLRHQWVRVQIRHRPSAKVPMGTHHGEFSSTALRERPWHDDCINRKLFRSKA